MKNLFIKRVFRRKNRGYFGGYFYFLDGGYGPIPEWQPCKWSSAFAKIAK